MDKMRLGLLEEKRKEILRAMIQFEFDAKSSRNYGTLNNKTLEHLQNQLKIIDTMISENGRVVEKVFGTGSIEK